MTIFEGIELASIDYQDHRADPRPNRVLAVSYFGVATCLERQGEALAYEVECVGEDYLLTDSIGEPPSDGAWVYEGSTSGSRDYWTGEYDYCWDGVWRPVTEAEWNAHVAGEWVWESLPEAQFRAASHTWLRRRGVA